MGAIKYKYVINHASSPYFSNDLQDRLSQYDYFVIGFDESLNKICQRGQIYIFVKYFDINRRIVRTEYFSSVFLGRARAQDLLNNFVAEIKPLQEKTFFKSL